MKCEVELRRNQNRIFAAGEAICGAVVIQIGEAACINAIICQIVGYAKCSWSVETSISSLPHVSRVNHLSANFLLLHKPRNGQLFQKGTHRFQFFYQLPSALPSSYHSANGCIKYKMLITVKRVDKSSAHFDYPFVVRQVIDLNQFEELSRPLLKIASKEFTIDFTSKRLHMSALIAQQGFIPNQIVDVRVQLDNQSIVHVKHVKISLKKIVKFTIKSPNVKQHVIESTEAVAYCGSVAGHEKKFFIKYLKIPQVPATIVGCEIIQVRYEIQVKAKTAGATRSAAVRLPITIGTVQLFRDDRRDYELEVMEPRRLDFAPMSYEECLTCPVTPESSDLIDFNLPSYDEAIKQSKDQK